jgi:hypothetical protein
VQSSSEVQHRSLNLEGIEMVFCAQKYLRTRVSARHIQTQQSCGLKRGVAAFVCLLAMTALEVPIIAQSPISPLMNQVNDLTQTPIPGSGHDYQQLMGETVNYSNGSVSFKVSFPVPASRGFTIPYSWTYNSASVNTMDALDGVTPHWNNSSNYNWPKKDGWNLADGTPWASISYFSQTPPSGPPNMNLTPCHYLSGITFTDMAGVSHSLPTAAVAPASNGSSDFHQCDSSPLVLPPQGDGQAIAILWPGNGPNLPSASGIGSFLVEDKDGKVYSFSLGVGPSTATANGPGTVEDSNGNYVNGSTDTAGRSFNVTGTPPTSVTIAGQTYTATWGTTSVSYTVSAPLSSATGVSCQPFQTSVVATKQVLSTLELPEGAGTYQFFYDNNYGLLSEIIFPNGGWIKYTYQLPTGYNEELSLAGFTFDSVTGRSDIPSTYGCNWQYQTPVLAWRYVSFDGINTAQTQKFDYSTNWQFSGGVLNGWSTKTTTVTTTDNIRNQVSKIVYLYGYTIAPAAPFQSSQNAAQIPQENTTTYYDWGGTTVTKMVTKVWYDNFNLSSETTTLYTNGGGTLTSRSVYTYTGSPCGSVSSTFTYLLRQDDYDYSNSSSPARTTKYNYKCFNNFANPPYMAGSPSSTYSRNSQYYLSPPSNWGSTYEGIVVTPKLYSVVVEDGTGIVSATQYNYDEGAAPVSVSASQLDPAYASVTSRGNLTSILRCNPAPTAEPTQPNSSTPICTQGPKTTDTYDITGRPVTMTDPMIRTTTFSFVDQPTDAPRQPTQTLI